MKFSRSCLCHDEPERYDALLPREREVLALWDGGASPQDIAATLSISCASVKTIVRIYDDRDAEGIDHKTMMKLGSELLRQRILQFHPHVAFGGES
ncbi:MAG: LuxR C-terminal-related transcriptional regulator [Erythrobacter sp.]